MLERKKEVTAYDLETLKPKSSFKSKFNLESSYLEVKKQNVKNDWVISRLKCEKQCQV